MQLTISQSKAPSPSALASSGDSPASVTLGNYLAAVASTVAAGMPQRSWVEATVAAAKLGSYGHALQLVDPAGGSSAPTMRAFLRSVDREAIARRLGTPVDPQHLVGMTVVVQIEPEFNPRWGMGGRIVGLSEALRESLLRRALEEIRARLRGERLYDRQRRLSAPLDVVRVAVVHPAGAAGYADVAGELARWQRAGIVTVTSVTSAFEGPHAALELVAALRRAASGDGVQPDVVVMVRGGGDRAGLLSLDSEAVARAVCLCSAPVIVGLGHAVDRSLVDEVAWATCDTPSKAVAHVARLIAAPARRACADMDAVMTAAELRVGKAERDLMQARSAALAGAERRLATADRELGQTRDAALGAAERSLARMTANLASTWTSVRAGIAGARERCASLEREVRGLLDAVGERAPRNLDAIARHLDRFGADAMAAARRRLDRADDGAALIGAVLTLAGAQLDSAAADSDQWIGSIGLSAARRLTDASIDLGRLVSLAESFGLHSTLARGFVLATTLDGTLVPSRAVAIAAGRLSLTFVDGALLAHVGTALTSTTQTGTQT